MPLPEPPPEPPCRTIDCWGVETKESKKATEDYRIASEEWNNELNAASAKKDSMMKEDKFTYTKEDTIKLGVASFWGGFKWGFIAASSIAAICLFVFY